MILERIKFMKVNKHKTFHFVPRYYDERKERIERIKERYSAEKDLTSLERQAHLRDKLQTAWYLDNSHGKQAKRANIRIVVIMVILLMAAYYILGYVDLFTAEVIDLDQ